MASPRDNPLEPSLARTLAQKLLDGQLVLFVGAGLSHLAQPKDGSERRLPLWKEFIESIAQTFSLRFSDGSFLDVLDKVVTKRGRPDLLEAINQLVDDGPFELSPAHLALKELPWAEVVTTNYDHLLSRLFGNRQPICSDEDCVRIEWKGAPAPRLFHIHGALPLPHTVTRQDYRNWEKNHPRLAQEIRQWMLRKTILFVGYGFGDSNIEFLLDVTHDWTADLEKTFYALSWRLEEDDIELLQGRDKIKAASIETPEEWENAFRQIQAELAQLQTQGPSAPENQDTDTYAYDRAQYLQALQSRYGVANLQGLYIWGAGYARDDVRLEEIFVEPDLCEWQTRRGSNEPEEEAREFEEAGDSEYERARMRQERLRDQASRREPALSLLNRENRLCIIGAPGQGKSTLLRRYLLKASADWRDQPEQPFPIYLRLSEWEQHSSEKESRFPSLASQAIARLGEISGPALDAWLKGRVLWLLDGVDEIRDSYQRQSLQEELLTLLAQRQQDRAVLATRPQGYPLGGFGVTWRDVELPPLNPEQSRLVLTNWGEVLKRKEANLSFDAPAVGRELERQPGLRQIRGNALLLTLVVLFYKNHGRLPHDRWEYFDKAEQALRDSWLAFRLPESIRVKSLPSGDYLPVFLERLALHGMKQGIVTFPADTLKNLARQLLQERRYTGREIDEEIQRLLRAADDLIGVIAAIAPELYGFLHLAFQEFLAARALVNRSDWCRQVIADYWDEPDWSEVWAFYAKGICEDQARWKELFSTIQANNHELDQYLHRDKLACLRLGGFCLGVLPKEWENFEGSALQGLDADNHLSVYASLKERERPLPCVLLAPLLKRLGDWNRDKRLATVGVLSWQVGTPKIQEALIERLGDKYFKVRDVAAESLAEEAGSSEVQIALLARLEHKDSVVRDAVIRSLAGHAGVYEIRMALVARLGDEHWAVRQAAAKALAWQAAEPEVQEALLAHMRDSNLDVRQAVARALVAQALVPKVRTALFALLKDVNRFVRQASVWALAGQTGDPSAREALLSLLDDDYWAVRQSAIDALADQAGESNVQAKLLAWLQDGYPSERQNAAKILASQAGVSEIRTLLLARLVDENSTVRRMAIGALTGQASDPVVRTALLARLEDIDWNVREAAIGALIVLAGEPEVRAKLLARLNDGNLEVRRAAAGALVGQAGEPEVRGALLARLKDGAPTMRRAVAETLVGQASEPEVRAELLIRLEDEASIVRWAAAYALAKQAVDPAVRVALLARLGDDNTDVRRGAAEALIGQADEPGVRAALLKRLSDEDSDVRQAASNALAMTIQRNRRRQRREQGIGASIAEDSPPASAHPTPLDVES